ncbi:MAG: hypothetical protein ACRD3M_16455, partial [Thermoanaerobaculia bacterium]
LKQDLPKHRGGYYWSARAYEAQGEYGKCVATLQDFRPYGRDFDRDNVKASCYYKNGQLQEVIGALPDEERLGDNYKKYAGWPVWLRGQIARRKLFSEMKPKLRAQATAPSERERTIALAKLALLGVPEGAELADLAGAADKDALKPVSDSLKKELLAEPRFYQELESPRVPDEAKRVRLEEAFAQMWDALDEKPQPGPIPPIAGKYMTKEMLELAKTYPSSATPLHVQIDDTGGRYTLGYGWMKTNGEVDTSFEPGRSYSIAHVKDGALWTVSAWRQNRMASFATSATRPDGDGLVQTMKFWIDQGVDFYATESVIRYVRIP